MAAIGITVQDIQVNNKDLFTFAYHLRKQDPHDLYTRLFLEKNLKSKVLIEIICSNIWKDADKFKNNATMVVDSKYSFRAQLGDAIL